MNDLIGTTIGGKYRLEKQLGAGGMGMVFAATQIGLNRKCAVKLLHEALSQDGQLVARFKREAEVAASIGHPNIIQVTDFGYEDGKIFLVMDLLQGMPLADAMRQGPFAAERVRFIATQVLSALEAAHQREIVHRDLKPDNIFLTSLSGVTDVVKLLDFGIARMTSEQSQKMTTTGQVLGTPAYMSPEQARGKQVDLRTDLYSLGVVMYEALSGRMPVKGSNYHELMFNIVGETPTPLRELRPDLPKALLDVVAKAMAKDVDERYQSAIEMRRELDALGPLEATSPQAINVPSDPPRRMSDADALAKTITPEAVLPVDSQRPPGPSRTEAPSTQNTQDTQDRDSQRAGGMPLWLGLFLIVMLGVGGGVYAFTRPDPEVANAPPQVDQEAESERVLAQANRYLEEMRRLEQAQMESHMDSEMDSTEMQAETVVAETVTVPSPEPNMSSMSTTMSSMSSTKMSSHHGARPRHASHSWIDAPPPTNFRRRQGCCRDEWHDRGGLPIVWAMCGSGERAAPRELYFVTPSTRITVSSWNSGQVVDHDQFRAWTPSHHDAITQCFRNHAVLNGDYLLLDVDARGTITGVRMRAYCPAQPAVASCLSNHFRGEQLTPGNNAPGEIKMGIGVAGR